MEHARPPAELNMDATGGPVGRADAWKKWRQQFMLFVKASGVQSEPSSVQASLLVNLIGSDGFDIYQTFSFDTEAERDDVNVLLKKYDAYFGTKPNITLARYKFFTRSQEDGESILQYVTALRLLSKNCGFGTLEEDLIKDRIVCGIRLAAVRDRLLRSDELTLDKAIKMCQAEEVSQESGRQMCSAGVSTNNKEVVHVDGVTGRGRRGSGWRPGAGASGGAARGRAPPRREFRAPPAQPPTRAQPCSGCGHARCPEGRCPALFADCFICGGKGHFARACKSSQSFYKSGGRDSYDKVRRVYEVDREHYDDESDEEEEFYISTIENSKTSSENWFQVLVCENGSEKFKLDTGADCNVLGYKRFLELGFTDNMITKQNVPLLSYTHDVIPIKGTCILPWSYKGIIYELKFAIADMRCSSVLGRKSCETMGLVKRIRVMDMSSYNDLFKGVGCLPGKYHIVIDKSVPPAVCASRKIPHGQRDQLRDELKTMEQKGIIRKVSHPTQWVHPLVLVAKKDDGIRVCLDPRELNHAVQRAHFHLPTLAELAARLHGARYFSVLDANSGFWAVQLDEESADLCTFATPFGRFQFLRLPFGINCASEVFHAKVRQLLEDLEGVENYIDDIIIWGPTKEIHDQRLKKLLDRAREINLKFNKNKCKICVKEVTYLGHVFDANGMRPDYNKIKAIKEICSPNDRKSLERFLGAVNYLSKFIPNYSEIAIPLTNLLKKENEWRWDESERRAFERLKECVTEAGVLALYDPRRPVRLAVDASSAALGAVLLQDGRPVEYASRTLTDTQKRYAQIEKELLAIVFACERFHQYIYGQQGVIVDSDHKPLQSIFKKPLMSVPARLQRMMLRIQGYDLIVNYVPGKYMYIPDMLSRSPLPDLYSDEVSKNILYQVQMIVNNVPISNDKLTLIKRETKKDEVLNAISKYVTSGWPDNKYDVANNVKEYWSIKDELFIVDEVLFKDKSVVIPRNLRNTMLSIIHEGHLGIDRCKRRARQVMFWPHMSRDIELYVKRCKVCQEYSNAPTKEPMLPIEIPKLPWFKVGSDIFELNKKYYLIIVDYYSNYVEVSKLNNITTETVIEKTKEVFSRHGIPKIFISDNATQYTSRKFKQFAQEWGFDHVTSSPNYPQSNGKSERTVQTVKQLLLKSIKSNGDFNVALLNFRNTPRDGLSSPAQLLMGRRLRCQLPVHHKLLEPRPINPLEYKTMIDKQNKSKMMYDKHCKILPDLKTGDSVIYIDGKTRGRATVIGQADTPRSYIVQNKVGARYRRNRRHLIKCATGENESQKNQSSSGELSDEFSDACEGEDHKVDIGTEYDSNHIATTSRESTSPLLITKPVRKAKVAAQQKLAKK